MGMLVLGRKIGQKILIGDDITVTVVNADGGSASIGIDAPRDVPVDREEVRERKLAESETPPGAL